MLKELRNLFQVKDFYYHFMVTSVVYLVLPNLIHKVYPVHSNEMELHGHQWCNCCMTQSSTSTEYTTSITSMNTNPITPSCLST